MSKLRGVEVCSHATNSGYVRTYFQIMMYVLVVAFAVIAFSLAVFSQTNFGRISGAVTDQSGGAIVGATVTVTDTARGVSRTLTTDAAGQYTAPSLVPGTYLVHVEFSGFTPAEQRGIEVPVGGDVRADMQLQPSSQSQTVTVTEAAPQINVTNATINDTMEASDVTNLPVLGGQWEYLFALRPGMTSKPGGGSKSQASNGLRVEQNSWLFDGMYNGKISNGGVLIGAQMNITDQGSILPLDAIQEFNFVQEPKAEYGWKPGGTVDAGVKSGTNSMHGTGHIEGRNAAIVAQNAFTPPGTSAVNNFVQFGASVGGPIKKDKLFYFGDYEGQRYNVGLPANYVVPTVGSYTTLAGGGGVASPGFSFPDAIADINTHAPGTVSALSAAMAGCTAGLTSTNPAAVVCSVANQGGNGGLFGNSGLAQETLVQTQQGGSNNGIGRVDYQLNGKNSINGDLFWGGTPFVKSGQNIQPFFRPVGSSYAQMVRASWIWTPTSSLVNTARFGFDRLFIDTQNGDCVLPHPNYAALGFVTGVPQVHYPFNVPQPSACGFPTTNITNLSPLGSATGQLEFEHYPAVSDDVSWTKGAHQFLFGGEIRWQRIGGGQSFTNNSGTINFGSTAAFTVAGVAATSLEDFMTGTASATGSSLLTNPQGAIQAAAADDYAIFAQDDWRVTPKLTLNLGLRYEYQQPWWATNNRWSRFDPTQPTGLLAQTGSTRIANGNFTRGIMPRFGLAYDITGKSTTVFRAGFALMNNFEDSQGETNAGRLSANPTGALFSRASGMTIQGTGIQNTSTAAISGPTIKAAWLPNKPIFGSVLGATTRCGNGIGTNPSPCNIWGIDPNIAPARVYEWNVSVQHAFTNSTSLTLSYVGNHAQGLWIDQELNAPPTGAGYVLSGTPPTLTTTQAAAQVLRPNYASFPWFGTAFIINPVGESNYNALQTTLTQRVSHGLNATVGYTYAHALDTESSDFPTNPQNPYRPGLEYGNGDNDARHHFSVTTTYLLPSRKAPAQMLEGWQFNTTFQFISALPATLTDTTSNVSGTGDNLDRWTLVGDPSQFPVGHRPNTPCYGVTGSSFAKTANCTTVAAIANMPTACINAATNEPVNTTNPVLAGTTGLTSLAKFGCYMEGSTVIVPPAPGTYGGMGRNQLRAKGFQEWDASISKSWKIKEGMTAQAVISAFNVLNSVELEPPVAPQTNPNAPSAFATAASTTDVGQNSAVLGQGGPRKFQFGVKFIF